MKLSNLSLTALEKIKVVRWDRIIEKHEGPEEWESVLRYYDPEFMEVEGRWILLPIDCSSHANITILRTIWSESGHSVTLFLKDTTYDDDPFFSGFMAVCDKIKDENFFLAIVYHEWFIIEPAKGIFES
ncbi:conserved hypothetical protein [Gloeothece citriformis PCC 7424]|uniref:Uncharacterized protein n=1 Tax=Gloeothece citriformis (strain PCC 7424) TaxID=65393 RepID=B7KK28_GLOC7|nr:hypothetical protein [Gloeothece citriformis]ACK70913.1 conserved hypothetical protein [Gloeothece citriformis PCC 7424]